MPSTPIQSKRRVTLKDIASEAKLSVASVSMALRNSPNVSSATIERVKQIADTLGYRPDPSLSALAEYRRRIGTASTGTTIALVTNWDTEDAWIRRADAAKIIEKAKERANELGYSLQHFWAGKSGISSKRLNDILQARGIRAVLLADSPLNRPQPELDWSQYAVVSLERGSFSDSYDFLEPDQYTAVALCWQKILERGFRRIGLVTERDSNQRWTNQWEAAHIQLQRHYCDRADVAPTFSIQSDTSSAELKNWLYTHSPDVVIGGSPSFFSKLKEFGPSLPCDFSYVSLDAECEERPHAGIRQRFDLIGRTAIDLLNKNLCGNHTGLREIPIGTMICGTWQDSDSLPSNELSCTQAQTPELARLAS